MHVSVRTAAAVAVAVSRRAAVDRADSEAHAVVPARVIGRRLPRHRARHALQTRRRMPHLLQLHASTHLTR